MKRKILSILTVIFLAVMLYTTVSANTGAFNNYSAPHIITLPSDVYGGNQINLAVEENLDDYSADQKSRYKWGAVTTGNDAWSACQSLKFNVTNRLTLTTVNGNIPLQKTKTFYSSSLDLNTYNNATYGLIETDDITVSSYCYYKTVITSTVTLNTIKTDTYTHSL